MRLLLIGLFVLVGVATPAGAQDAGCAPACESSTDGGGASSDGQIADPLGDSAPADVVLRTPEAPTGLAPALDSSAVGWAPAPRTKTAGCVSIGGLPDAACTPGAVDPRVTQATIATTICVPGYTASVRPSTAVTHRIKVQEMTAYGMAGQPLATEELDHLIPLELGGAPADVANLWPQSWTVVPNAREKDVVENDLHRRVCSGALSLVVAQQEIATDWYAVYVAGGVE